MRNPEITHYSALLADLTIAAARATSVEQLAAIRVQRVMRQQREKSPCTPRSSRSGQPLGRARRAAAGAGGGFGGARVTSSLCSLTDPNAVRVLRDTIRLLHFEENGVPVCGYDGDVIDALHPLDRAAMWCSACMQTLAARYPRRAVDLRG